MREARPVNAAAGLVFGRYETLFRIGAGGMAEVFAGRLLGEAGFERLVAIKRLLPHLCAQPEFVTRFLDEGRLAARIAHPHVVQTLDLGRDDQGAPFLVLELVMGASFDHLSEREQRLSVPLVLTWMSQAAEGLHAAHTARASDGTPLGLVHRDISPQNILVGLDGNARIGDFGIAQASLLKSTRTPIGRVAGKPAYFSPEQAMGQTLDARSDVFALGVVTWEALTGQRLFDADHPAQSMTLVLTHDPAPPHTLCPEIPQRISDIVMASLHRNPAQRTPSAQDFALALSTAARELDLLVSRADCTEAVRAVQDPVWREGTTRPLQQEPFSQPNQKARSSLGWQRALWLGIFSLAAGLALVVAVRISTGSRAIPEVATRRAADVTKAASTVPPASTSSLLAPSSVSSSGALERAMPATSTQPLSPWIGKREAKRPKREGRKAPASNDVPTQAPEKQQAPVLPSASARWGGRS